MAKIMRKILIMKHMFKVEDNQMRKDKKNVFRREIQLYIKRQKVKGMKKNGFSQRTGKRNCREKHEENEFPPVKKKNSVSSLTYRYQLFS